MTKEITADVIVDREVTIRVKNAFEIKDDLKSDGYKFDGINWVLNYKLSAKTQNEADTESLAFRNHLNLLAIHGVKITKFGAVDQFLKIAADAKERQIAKRLNEIKK